MAPCKSSELSSGSQGLSERAGKETRGAGGEGRGGAGVPREEAPHTRPPPAASYLLERHSQRAHVHVGSHPAGVQVAGGAQDDACGERAGDPSQRGRVQPPARAPKPPRAQACTHLCASGSPASDTWPCGSGTKPEDQRQAALRPGSRGGDPSSPFHTHTHTHLPRGWGPGHAHMFQAMGKRFLGLWGCTPPPTPHCKVDRRPCNVPHPRRARDPPGTAAPWRGAIRRRRCPVSAAGVLAVPGRPRIQACTLCNPQISGAPMAAVGPCAPHASLLPRRTRLPPTPILHHAGRNTDGQAERSAPTSSARPAQ